MRNWLLAPFVPSSSPASHYSPVSAEGKERNESEEQEELRPLAWQDRRRPRSQRVTRFAAIVGWGCTLLLLAILVVSHSSIAPKIPRLELGEALHFRLQTHSRRTPVTVVSGFYFVAGGRKHSVESTSSPGGSPNGHRLSSVAVKLSRIRRGAHHLLHVAGPRAVHQGSTRRQGMSSPVLGGVCSSTLQPITIIGDYKSAFEMEPIQDLGGSDWATAQHAIDPEKDIQMPDLCTSGRFVRRMRADAEQTEFGRQSPGWCSKPRISIPTGASTSSGYVHVISLLALTCSQVDAGSFRDPSAKHTFSKLGERLDAIYAEVPNDTIVLSSTVLPFEDGLEYVKAATRSTVMDRADRLQGGWYGGKAEGIDWWAAETMKTTIQQGVMQRSVFLPARTGADRTQVLCEGAARVDPDGTAQLEKDLCPGERALPPSSTSR